MARPVIWPFSSWQRLWRAWLPFCGLGGFFRRAFVDGVPGPVPFVHVHGAGGQKRYGSVQVVFVSHFNNLVHIAGGNGNGPGNGTARNRFLHGSGIRASRRQHFRLPFNFVGVCHGLHELDHAAVCNDGTVIQLDGGACAQVGNLVVRRSSGNVTGDGDVQGNGEIRLDVQRAGLRAPQAHFLPER